MGWGRFKMPSFTPTLGIGSSSFTPTLIEDMDFGVPNIPNVPAISYGGSTTPKIPIPNIPTPGGSFNDIAGGLSLLTDNAAYVAEGAIDIAKGVGDRLAMAGKEAMTGEGGYVDDQPGGPPPPGPTGFEAATRQSTLLTVQRKKGAGRSAHSGRGSASTV